MKIKILIFSFISGFVVSLIVIFVANHRIVISSKKQLYNDTDSIPSNHVGLLLGTAKYLKSGRTNRYFEYRIIATAQLYQSEKIKNIVISGDNSRTDYNEPQDMKDELIKRGIPADHIYLDYAGFRTFDSVYRMKAIFGQSSFTIISQAFHNQRAVYIANTLNLKTVAFNAKDVDAYNGFKTQVREKLARVKVFMDILFNKQPKFLGERITIE